jgi:hypothetical protein
LLGVCQPLAGDGGACGVAGLANAQDMCSYRGSGSNGQSCQEWVPGSPTVKLEAGAWFCAPQTPLNSPCGNNLNCTTFECGSTHECASSSIAVGAGSCPAFYVDAGGGD